MPPNRITEASRRTITPVPSGDSGYTLRLCEDTLPVAGRGALAALNRVLYVRRGAAVLATAEREGRLAEGEAWHGAHGCEIHGGEAGATVLRYELIRGSAPLDRVSTGATKVLLEHAIDLDPRADYLMRADRVDFAPGGVALPHRHRGGGIRCLLAGALEVTVGEAPARTVTPGGAWFESGREPVLAVASTDEPTSFVRVAILPREIRGRTSIMYVDPKDAERGRPRAYTVFVDEPIEIG
jgi:quercetin dioxygenase-like cupin family protein